MVAVVVVVVMAVVVVVVITVEGVIEAAVFAPTKGSFFSGGLKRGRNDYHR